MKQLQCALKPKVLSHIYIHDICIFTYIYIHIYIHTFIYTYMYIYMYMYIHMYTFTYHICLSCQQQIYHAKSYVSQGAVLLREDLLAFCPGCSSRFF